MISPRKKQLTVVIAHYNDTPFIEISLYALARLTKNRFKVIICDNGSRYRDRKKLERIVSKYRNVELIFRKQTTKGSMGHGEALNILIDKIDTPYGVILDADATFLKKEWDEILMNQLSGKVTIVGAPPVKNTPKPTDFPLTFAVLFDTKIFKALDIDLRPKNIKAGLDTGWQMRGKYLRNGYTCKVLEVRNTREYKDGPFKNVLCVEYYFEGPDIFGSHFGRGATLGAAKYKGRNRLLRVPILNIVATSGAKRKGYKERNEWLAICKKIIDKEAEI